MFDIEKAKEKGLGEKDIEILKAINEDNQKEESCTLHEFERARWGVYICKRCGCEKGSEFVHGYKRDLEHGRRQQNGIERR